MLTIVHENKDFVVVNKPAGISVQNEQQASGILAPLCEQLKLEKLWLVHRLDKVTSGILLLAKHAVSAAGLSELFRERKIEKYYLALTDNKPKKKQGRIFGDMKKVRDGKWMLTKQTDAPALTQFFSFSLQLGIKLMVLKPYTGKTHQLRVALKSLGSAILGDSSYAGTASDRTYLHAHMLKFSYKSTPYEFNCLPESGEYFTSSTFIQYMRDLPNVDSLAWPKLPFALLEKCKSRDQQPPSSAL